MKKNIKAIAVVLPQFHPIPENDEWWGKGFTEWTNVTKAKPLFKDHYQPHLPADLGFYDLRLEEAREAQAEIAKVHGIGGFCYYHYWFNGKRLLEYPINEILKSQKPDMPFMLCWANENWTRRWDGLDKEILISQEYSFQDDENHIRWLCANVFNDPRYIRVNDKPVFIIYRSDLFPDIKETLAKWRKIAKEEFGYKDLYLCVMESFSKKITPTIDGFDAAIEFSPHHILEHRSKIPFKNLVLNKLKRNTGSYEFRDYKRAVEVSVGRKLPDYKLFRSVTPSWDNTPRKKENGVIAKGSTPKVYKNWLTAVIKGFTPFSEEENFVFINAMNEWAEGNHLEPCVKYGKQYLVATKEALEDR